MKKILLPTLLLATIAPAISLVGCSAVDPLHFDEEIELEYSSESTEALIANNIKLNSAKTYKVSGKLTNWKEFSESKGMWHLSIERVYKKGQLLPIRPAAIVFDDVELSWAESSDDFIATNNTFVVGGLSKGDNVLFSCHCEGLTNASVITFYFQTPTSERFNIEWKMGAM